MTLATDGAAHDLVQPGDVHAATTAKWTEGQLDVTSEYEGGLEIEQSFQRDPASASRLLATIRIHGGPRGGTRTFRAVYHPASPDSAGGS